MPRLAYCDYVAQVMRTGLIRHDDHMLIDNIGSVKFDLNQEGAFVSTKKRFEVIDKNGTVYLITVEEKQ